MKKKASEAKEMAYRMRVYPIDADTDEMEWVAEFPDLPGCVGAGKTPEEAVAMAIDAKKAWIEVAQEDGMEIPEPTNPYDSDYSGKFTLRLPKTLHKELVLRAEDEGVSLNQYILYLISKGLNKETSAAKEMNNQSYAVFMIEAENAAESWKSASVPIELSDILSNYILRRKEILK